MKLEELGFHFCQIVILLLINLVLGKTFIRELCAVEICWDKREAWYSDNAQFISFSVSFENEIIGSEIQWNTDMLETECTTYCSGCRWLSQKREYDISLKTWSTSLYRKCDIDMILSSHVIRQNTASNGSKRLFNRLSRASSRNFSPYVYNLWLSSALGLLSY